MNSAPRIKPNPEKTGEYLVLLERICPECLHTTVAYYGRDALAAIAGNQPLTECEACHISF